MSATQSSIGAGGAGPDPQEPTMADILAALRGLRTQMEMQGVKLEKLEKQGEQLGLRIDALETRSTKGQGQSKHSPLGTSRSSTPSAGVGEGGSSDGGIASGGSGGGGGGGGGDGGGGGGGGQQTQTISPLSGSGTSSPRSAQLRAAFHTSSQLHRIILKTGSSRNLSTPLQEKVMVHRLLTDFRLSDFDYTAVDLFNFMVQPNPEKGLSLFIVASEDPKVVAAAHVVRGAITKGHRGCVSWCLATLPQNLVVTLDRELEKAADGVPIVWHATLSPKSAMTFKEFEAAFKGWAGLTVCELRGAGKEDCETGPEHRDDLCTLSEGNAPYLLAKLSGHSASLARNVGGSPGTA